MRGPSRQTRQHDSSQSISRLANSDGYRCGESGSQPEKERNGTVGDDIVSGPGPTNGFWRAADWVWCQDLFWRPVKPNTSPLANVATSRVVRGVRSRTSAAENTTEARAMRLKMYGNAINAESAKVFVQCAIEELLT